MLLCCLHNKRKSMLNNLPLIIVMILSLSLTFYCVDSHKNNIVTMVDLDDKQITNQKITPLEPPKKVYVEVLAVNDENETNKTEPQITEELKEEPIVENIVNIIEPTETKEIVEIKVEIKKPVDDEIISEYSEGYKLDKLEKMIEEELKKGNKD